MDTRNQIWVGHIKDTTHGAFTPTQLHKKTPKFEFFFSKGKISGVAL